MRELFGSPIFTAVRLRVPVVACLMLPLAVLSGCGIRKTVKIEVPEKILAARTASFEELADMLQGYDRIRSLSSSLDITYSYGKRESGVIQEIRKQPGYILLRRPDATHLVVQNFVTKMRELEVLSEGDALSIYYRRENALYVGKNSARNLVVASRGDSGEFSIPIRGAHIYEAIFPQSIRFDAPGFLYSMEEASDAEAKYYVLNVHREGASRRILPVRKLWVERSSLAVARQQAYLEDGQVASDISYSNETEVDGLRLPLRIRIDRPLDGYALDLEFKGWRVNPDLPDGAFSLKLPHGVPIIHLVEK